MIADVAALFDLDAIAGYFGLGGYGLSVLRVIGVDIVLAGDNAVVIALACRTLPPRQRRAGIVLGTGAAVAMRIIFTLVVGSLLGIPMLALAGGLILIWIALKLLLAEETGEEAVRSGETLWAAVKTVAIADAVMSLDNVLAIAGAARGDWGLIVTGLLISIPIVVGGSTLIMAMLSRYPVLVWGGAALLGWIAGELIVGEQLLVSFFADLAGTLGIAQHTLQELSGPLGALLVVSAGFLFMRMRNNADPGRIG
jgi:YjbE family integral membrane protein